MKALNLLCFWDGNSSDLIYPVLLTCYFLIFNLGWELKWLDNQDDLSCVVLFFNSNLGWGSSNLICPVLAIFLRYPCFFVYIQKSFFYGKARFICLNSNIVKNLCKKFLILAADLKNEILEFHDFFFNIFTQ